MSSYDVLCIGSATMDFIARPSRSERIDINHLDRAEHLMCLTFASKTLLEDLTYECGGSAGNSATVMTLLGADVKILTAVGDDTFSEMIVDDLQKRGIGTEYVQRIFGKKSSVGISLLSGNGEKSTLIYRGANDFLAPSHLTPKMVQDCETVFITSLTSRINYALFLRAIHLARKYEKKIVFAPSITMLKRFPRRLAHLHQKFDLCVMNYEEGMYYTRQSGIENVLRAIPGVARVITKDREGSYALDRSGYYHAHSTHDKIVDTTGAGDAFTGALTFEYGRTGDIASAISAGAAMASIKLSRLGPRVDLTPAQAKDALARSRKKYGAERLGPGIK